MTVILEACFQMWSYSVHSLESNALTEFIFCNGFCLGSDCGLSTGRTDCGEGIGGDCCISLMLLFGIMWDWGGGLDVEVGCDSMVVLSKIILGMASVIGRAMGVYLLYCDV